MKLRVWLTTKSPLVISRHRATGNQLESLRHIPGTVWRGALAAHWMVERGLKENVHLHPEFELLFLSGRVRFGDLRHQGQNPFPLSGRICSRHDHRILDLLLCRELGEPLPRTCGSVVANGICEAKIVPHEGIARINEGMLEAREPAARIAAHSAIANESLRVSEGQFHISTIVERRQTFIGEALAQDEQAAVALEGLCRDLPEITIGRGTTRGQGLAELKTQRLDSESGILDTGRRLRAFNDQFRRKGRLGFTVTLCSPCVVYDQWNRSKPYLTGDDLDQAAGEVSGAFSDYQLVEWFSRLMVIQGWNAQSGLPKTDSAAIAPGSAFLFMGNITEARYESEIHRLAGLLVRCADGIGERWEEGFGEASFCDPIHFREDKP